ncbi:MAG: class I SAM-dependent methyltransferase [Chloroflexota bacterium]|nr:class I SAM-dependent methyltransferase [Chloroflexota bacterium]
MNNKVQQQLLKINQSFYQQYATSFSATRGRVQPGVRLILESVHQNDIVLDVGCGNGSLARALKAQSFQGQYLGVDMSAELLTKSRELMHEINKAHFRFCQVDMADPDWPSLIPAAPYDWLVSFAVLHHLPGAAFRQKTASTFSNLVSPRSKVAVSVWQWRNSPRLRDRVLPWSTLGLEATSIDEGDVLLDWRAGDTPGVRYVHTFDETSLTTLAENAGFQVIESFFSDGKGGNLGLYQVWQLTEK